jgi:hypothetical protein
MEREVNKLIIEERKKHQLRRERKGGTQRDDQPKAEALPLSSLL